MAAIDRGHSQTRFWQRHEKYDGMLDEEIVAYARKGSAVATEYLLGKYRALVEGKARLYYLRGADRDDVVQEGMIGLFKAIRDYRGDRLARFRAFAELCVTRQIITAVKRASRHKHDPLNCYVSIQMCDPDEDTAWTDRVGDDGAADPLMMMLRRQSPDLMRKRLESALSKLESQVFECYLRGKSYKEMALELSRRTKSIDNALQRVKKKIEAELVHLRS